ncbi:MAG: flagellar hook-basal body complex protein FliE [Acidobacteriales bacterium]|nr:flagellar hook-basal body complex protein FliE [Terriglobales bacterium]
MPLPIGSVGSAGSLPLAGPATSASRTGDFQKLFENAVNNVENLRAGAEQSAQRFLSGESEELHQTALATQRAEVAFDLFLQVRNKVVQAYQEVMRMQL